MSGCTGVFIEFSMKCCSSNAVKHKLPTSEELRVNGSGYAKMHCSPSPSFPLPGEEGRCWSPCTARRFRGLSPLKRGGPAILHPEAGSLVLQGSNSSHMRCSPASAEGRATCCRSQQQPGLLVGLEVGVTLGCCNYCAGYRWLWRDLDGKQMSSGLFCAFL